MRTCHPLGVTVRILKLCEFATKQENGRHSLIGIFEDIRVPQVPLDHPPFFVAAQMKFDPSECGIEQAIKFEFVDPSGEVILNADVPAKVEKMDGGDGPLATLLLQVGGMRLHRAGIHTLRVSLNGAEVYSETLPVAVVKVR